MKPVYFVSLGCDRNLVDTERMIAALPSDTYELTDDPALARIIVVNSCCFIDAAKEESIETILEMAAYKEGGSLELLVVAGCMAERYREEVLSEIPEVDAILGTSDFSAIADVIREAQSGKKAAFFEGADRQKQRKKRAITTGGFYEYLKIAEGCDKHCSYCVIPKLRGRYRSVPIEVLIEEANELAESGVRELILVAEETTRYGLDLYGEKRLVQLIKELAKIPEIRWIRLLYAYPEEIDEDLILLMQEEPKFCHYIDMPIQHANDEILKRMGRRTNKAELVETIRKFREAVPDLVLRTTLITGFPGETEAMHDELLAFVNEIRFDRLGVFTYSREEGTRAYEMPDQIDEEIKLKRQDEIMRAQNAVSKSLGEARIGTTVEAIVEGYLAADEVYACRTYADAPGVDGYLFLSTDEVLNSGDFVAARITAARDYDLIGEQL